jgi:hypothetical protein
MTKTFFEICLHHSQAITLSIEIFSRYSMICSVFHLQSENFYLMGLVISDHIRERRINTKCILGYFYFQKPNFSATTRYFQNPEFDGEPPSRLHDFLKVSSQ